MGQTFASAPSHPFGGTPTRLGFRNVRQKNRSLSGACSSCVRRGAYAHSPIQFAFCSCPPRPSCRCGQPSCPTDVVITSAELRERHLRGQPGGAKWIWFAEREGEAMTSFRRHLGRRVAGVGVAATLVVLGLEAPAFAVLPTITSFSPSSGPAGCVVVITGTDFDNPVVSSVDIGARR
jgi:hypothetical protein